MNSCPLCDNFGVIGVPNKPGFLKKCPECDTPPAWPIVWTAAQIVGSREENDEPPEEYFDELHRQHMAELDP